MMRLLLSAGADRTISDRTVPPLSLLLKPPSDCFSQHRTALYFAVKSGDIGMVRYFLGEDGCNMADKLWVPSFSSP
jgi:hypothetical protein